MELHDKVGQLEDKLANISNKDENSSNESSSEESELVKAEAQSPKLGKMFKKSATLRRSVLKSSDAKVKSPESDESSDAFSSSHEQNNLSVNLSEEDIIESESPSEHTKAMAARDERQHRI